MGAPSPGKKPSATRRVRRLDDWEAEERTGRLSSISAFVVVTVIAIVVLCGLVIPLPAH